MASKENDKGWNETTAGADANSEWNEVLGEGQILLEAEGEGFIGRYLGQDAPNANGIVQSHWDNVTDLNHAPLDGDEWFFNLTRDLTRKLTKVPEKSMVRLEWVSSMQTGQKTPMRVFKVQWR